MKGGKQDAEVEQETETGVVTVHQRKRTQAVQQPLPQMFK